MPELPEVETVRRGLAPAMEGQEITRLDVRRANLRFPFPTNFAARLEGARLLRLGRHAKFLAGDLSTGETLIMHLGMSGRFTIDADGVGQFAHDTGGDPKHDHIVFHMSNGVRVTYNDPRRFGFMELWPSDDFADYPRLRDMGPEPLSNGFSAPYLDHILKGRKSPIKAALLDQTVVAGLGNIYVCEALFDAGISPRRSAYTVCGTRAARLAPAINDVIAAAIQAGGSSISDFSGTDGALGYFQHRFKVYDRAGQPCLTCEKPVQRIVQSGRSSFFCGSCQR